VKETFYAGANKSLEIFTFTLLLSVTDESTKRVLEAYFEILMYRDFGLCLQNSGLQEFGKEQFADAVKEVESKFMYVNEILHTETIIHVFKTFP
jgi:hypothetical protein